MLDLPPLGNINLHASLLPKYRGAAPIQWAIARGESVTGVTTMRIDAGLDTGDILLQREMPIAWEDTAESLAPKIAAIGADLMVETLRGLQAHAVQPRPQDHSQASLAPILRKEDGRIDFNCTALEICNRLRGFQPWPGAFTSFRRRNLNVLAAKPAQKSASEGTLTIEGETLIVGCGGQTAIELLEVQPRREETHGRNRFCSWLSSTKWRDAGPIARDFLRDAFCPSWLNLFSACHAYLSSPQRRFRHPAPR